MKSSEMKNSMIVLLTFLFLFACSTNEDKIDDESQSSDAEIDSLIHAYYQTMSDRDWDKYATYFTDGAVLTSVWHSPDDTTPTILVVSIDEFIAQTGNGPDSQPIFEEVPRSIEIGQRGGKLASVWARYDAKFGSEQHLMEWSGYDLFSLINHKDEWKITALTYATIE